LAQGSATSKHDSRSNTKKEKTKKGKERIHFESFHRFVDFLFQLARNSFPQTLHKKKPKVGRKLERSTAGPERDDEPGPAVGSAVLFNPLIPTPVQGARGRGRVGGGFFSDSRNTLDSVKVYFFTRCQRCRRHHHHHHHHRPSPPRFRGSEHESSASALASSRGGIKTNSCCGLARCSETPEHRWGAKRAGEWLCVSLNSLSLLPLEFLAVGKSQGFRAESHSYF